MDISEDAAQKILNEQAERAAQHERDMEDPSYRWVVINAGELALLIPITDENAVEAIGQVSRGEFATFISTDGRTIGFPPGKIDAVSRLTYKHRFQDQKHAAEAAAAKSVPPVHQPGRLTLSRK